MDKGHLPSLQELQTLVPCAPTRTRRTQDPRLQSHLHPFLALLGTAGRAWARGEGGHLQPLVQAPWLPGVGTASSAWGAHDPPSVLPFSTYQRSTHQHALPPGGTAAPLPGCPRSQYTVHSLSAGRPVRVTEQPPGLIGPLSRKQRLLQERRHDLNVPDPRHRVSEAGSGDGAALGHPRGRGSTEGSRGSRGREAALKISTVFSADVNPARGFAPGLQSCHSDPFSAWPANFYRLLSNREYFPRWDIKAQSVRFLNFPPASFTQASGKICLFCESTGHLSCCLGRWGRLPGPALLRPPLLPLPDP